MEYSNGEIAFVYYCVNNLPDCRAGKRKCPVYESCIQDEECQQLCNRIVDSMKNGEVLSEEDAKIIEFFCTTSGLWEPDDSEKACHAKGIEKRCDAFAICEEEQKEICTELVQRITGEWRMHERRIQELIVADLKKSVVEWHVGEKLDFDRSWEKTDIGETDILLIGKETRTLYIVELKYPIAYREDVGQLASYVGWYKENAGKLQQQPPAVKGILLAQNFSEGAKFALKACPDLDGRRFDLHVEIKPVE